MTLAQAQAAVTSLWAAREKASTTSDVALFREVETGSELLESLYAIDSVRCGCSPPYWTKGIRPLRQVTIFLPRQTHYPVYFMAEVLASASPGATGTTADLFVTRDSPNQPWRIAAQLFDSGYIKPAPVVLRPMVDAQGYDAPVASPSEEVARTWPEMLAAYYNHLKKTGAPPAGSLFAPAKLTTGTDFAVNKDGTIFDRTVNHYRFTVFGPPWIVNIGGQTDSCAETHEEQTITPVQRGTAMFNPGRAPSWGPDLPIGFYSKVVRTWDEVFCIYQSGQRLYVWGATGGNVNYPIQDIGIRTKPVSAGDAIFP